MLDTVSETMTVNDTQVIRELARKVAEIAADPVNSEKRELWTRLNRLERVRPLIHVQAIARDIWEELIPGDQLKATDPFARLFREEHLVARLLPLGWDVSLDDLVVQRCRHHRSRRIGSHAAGVRPLVVVEGPFVVL